MFAKDKGGLMIWTEFTTDSTSSDHLEDGRLPVGGHAERMHADFWGTNETHANLINLIIGRK